MKIKYENKLNELLSLLVLISPVFFLTVKHWTNLVLLVLFVSCLNKLITEKELNSSFLRSKKWCQIICMMFLAPLVAVVLSQFLRVDLYMPNWDGPFRFVLCVPVFLVIANGHLRAVSSKSICQVWVTLVLPLTLLWTFFFRFNWPTKWGPDLTTYFVDPLTFGSYTLLFALLVLLGISEFWNKVGVTIRFLCGLAIFSGFYLSITSGSRTGWFNIPVFLAIWTMWVVKPVLGGGKTTLLVTVLLVFLLGMLLRNEYLLNKFVLIWTEISSYKINEMNADTSVGIRLSFYRMGVMFFLERPISGWGDLGWMAQINQPELMQFASQYARESPKHGFHNEIITNSIRSGVWGLIASLGLFGVVFIRAIHGMSLKGTSEHRIVSLTLLVFISHLFIAGLTTEITNLVFLSSFIGLSLAVLLGEQIYLEEKLLACTENITRY
jgi:O-antigen ligase